MDTIIRVTQIPAIEENLKSVSSYIDERVQLALSLVCTEETVKTVKAERSELNKLFGSLETERKAVKKAVLDPYNNFEKIYKECVSDKFKKADETLKNRIASVEDELKSQKESEVRRFFDEYKAGKVDWLEYDRANINITLTATEKKLKEQAKNFVDDVVVALNAINLQDNPEEFLYEYKKTLNLPETIALVTERRKALRGVKESADVEPEEKMTLDDILDRLNENSIRFTVDVPESIAKKVRLFIRTLGLEWKEEKL